MNNLTIGWPIDRLALYTKKNERNQRMSQRQFDGRDGLTRLKALIAAVFDVRGGAQGTQEFLLGWVYGLAAAGAIDENTVFDAQQFIGRWDFNEVAGKSIDLYLYPNETFQRVEGKSMFVLEEEIIAGGPPDASRVEKIYTLAADEAHSLHYVAKHYLFLSRATLASIK